jgi:hypothetical protein
MIVGKKDYNFELFGYDFLVDEDLRVWLIECNTNPYLGVANDFIEETLPKLADDILKIIVDPVFPPKNKNLLRTGESDFELIYCEANSTYNKGIPFSLREPFYE